MEWLFYYVDDWSQPSNTWACTCGSFLHTPLLIITVLLGDILLQSVSRSKNTLYLDTTLSFFTHLIVSCEMKKQKYTWHLLNVPFWLPFIWFYFYSFCHRLNFILWLCCVAVVLRRGFFFSGVFVRLMWFFFLLHAQLLSLLIHSFVFKQVKNTFSDQLSLSVIAQTHLSPGKGTINGPKSALFTPAETIIVSILFTVWVTFR